MTEVKERAYREAKILAYKIAIMDFFPVLEKIIKEWDNKQLNKKFYVALHDAVKQITKDHPYYFDTTGFWLDGLGGARVDVSFSIHELLGGPSFEILATADVKEYATTQPGRRPRVSSAKMLAILAEEKKEMLNFINGVGCGLLRYGLLRGQ